jgi:serine/threonine-protein kinase
MGELWFKLAIGRGQESPAIVGPPEGALVQSGTRLNHYEIVAPLGEGGMGRVYRATDTRLRRQVAIKVLPPELAGDAERLARLEREAQVLAQLEHPNVAAVYGLEEATVEGHAERFLVMQLAEGQTLAERLESGAVPVDEAVEIARRVALGLEAAHARGIVHRDLKPANIMLGSAGDVKLLDFGLAKALGVDREHGTDKDVAESPTMMAVTGAGVILGTAPYMSPEQARGKAVDRRADLWALGCVLYEMLAGRRAFDGETATDVIAKVVQSEPEWAALPPEVPAAIRRLLARCLAKNADARLRDAGDVALLLGEGLATGPGAGTGPPAVAGRSKATRMVPWTIAAAAVLLAALAWLMPSGADSPTGPERFSVSIAESSGVPVVDYMGANSLAGLALSPDGRQLAFVGHDGTQGSLWVQQLGEFEPVEIPGSFDAIAPFFSPDNRQLGFVAAGNLWRVALPGGVPVAVASASNLTEGATWTEGGSIVFTRSYADPLSLVDVGSGETRGLTKLDVAAGEASHRWPHALPGGRAVLFVVKTTTMESLDQGRIAVADLETGEHRVVLDGGTRPAYLESGHLVFARDGNLYAAPFDLDRLEVTGAPVQVLDGLVTDSSTGNAHYAVTRLGVLAYIPGGAMAASRQIWHVSPGEVPVELPLEAANYSVGDLAPDGRRLLVGLAAANDKLWVVDLATGSRTRLVGGPGNDQPGVFSADGRWVVFASDRQGGYVRPHRVPVDGSAEPELILDDGTWGPLGRLAREAGLLGYESRSSEGNSDAYVLPVDSSGALVGEPRLVAGGVGDQGEVAPSPDGTLVAYTSTEAGDRAVYVVAPESGNRLRLTRSTSASPVWDRTGTVLFYESDGRIFRVPLRSAATLSFGEPELVADNLDYSTFTLAADGRSLLAAGDEEREVRRRDIRIDLAWGRTVTRIAAVDR